jgi:outer membrane protein assembly factor BamB
VITSDEYGDDPVLKAMAKYVGNHDGVVTEEKWNFWGKHVLGSTGMVALQLGAEPRQVWRVDKGFEGVIPSPVIYDGIVYVVKNGGILTAFDAKTGERAKTGRLPGALGGYAASPVVADGLLYLASEEGKISVVRPGREWEAIRVNDLGEEIYATPALSKGFIFVRTGQALYCFGLRPAG